MVTHLQNREFQKDDFVLFAHAIGFLRMDAVHIFVDTTAGGAAKKKESDGKILDLVRGIRGAQEEASRREESKKRRSR